MTSTIRRAAGPGIAAWMAMLLAAHAAAAEPVDAPVSYEQAKQLCTIACEALRESSGLACGRANSGVFWTHNDSGSQPLIYAFNSAGEVLGIFKVAGAAERDWEDMASVAVGRNGYLLIADVGDNNAQRKDCTLYLVAEPVLKPRRPAKQPKPGPAVLRSAPPPETQHTKPCESVKFTYEDGPRNCEAAAIDAQTLKIYLVSKEGGPACKVYEVPGPKEWKLKRPLVAKAIAEIKVPTVSGMDISPDGRRALICTYGNAWEFTRKEGESWKDAFARQPREIPMPARPQGESICYGPDGRSIYLTSEVPAIIKADTPFYEVPAKKDESEQKTEEKEGEERTEKDKGE